MERHRLPSGFGTVRNLGPGRSRPFAVHPPASPLITESVRRSAGKVCSAGKVRGATENRGHPGTVSVRSKRIFRESGRERKKIWKRPPAICYVSNWESGVKVLALYHAGLYESGMENLVENGQPVPQPPAAMHGTREALLQYCQKVMEDIDRIARGELPDELQMEMELPDEEQIHSEGQVLVHGKEPVQTSCNEPTETADSVLPSFSEVYAAFFDYKYGPHAQRRLSQSARGATKAAYRRLASFYDKTLDEISVDDFQKAVNTASDAGCSRSAVTQIVTLIHQIYKYAWPRGLCHKEIGRYVEMPSTRAERHHEDFTDEELKLLWKYYRETKNPMARMILVMCYSGFRIGEYDSPDFELYLPAQTQDGIAYFRGGSKTKAGKDRIVPVHSAILPLVEEMNGLFFCGKSSRRFREDMKKKLAELGIDAAGNESSLALPGRGHYHTSGRGRYHTPHSCRHTFSRLCESYGVSESDRKRMLGHSLRADVTNGVYGHRTVKELHAELEKIQVPP